MYVSSVGDKDFKNPPSLSSFKGTVSRYCDVLLVVWMDRALFGDEPLTGFVTVCCLLVFTCILLSSEVLHKGCPRVCNWDNPLANMP
jgi:hypothetical protein